MRVFSQADSPLSVLNQVRQMDVSFGLEISKSMKEKRDTKRGKLHWQHMQKSKTNQNRFMRSLLNSHMQV